MFPFCPQTAILKWILDHDADKRPSAAELLQSDYLPQMEEQEVDELFRSTLANPQTKSYKKLISTIFSQPISRKFDFIYDNDAHKGVNLANLINKQIASQRLKNILSAHGAVELEVPLMLPKLSIYESCSQLVTFMDSAGNLVSLPFDLRVPFARFVARNNISNLKRYSISKVFRERKPHGIQPHEYIIAAFDIISSSKDSITPDVEVIFTIQQILDSFPYLQAKSYSIQINHSSLLKGILLFCGLPEDQLPVVYEVLTDSSNNKAGDGGKTSAYTKLLNSSINEKTASQICTFIAMSGSLSSVSGFLRRITKSGQQYNMTLTIST
ncbi:hypothetical protein EB796_018424 [Bugula neritina]|uniref:Uncharacterized protein n=1 Tax=Bugula neritina TaxID=10212 RepID=A0A7J7JBB2_BUGNE|nr:hypothetical protein EB796_018424 [Bugula neritina]